MDGDMNESKLQIDGDKVVITITTTLDALLAPIMATITKKVQDGVDRTSWDQGYEVDRAVKDLITSAEFRAIIKAKAMSMMDAVAQPSIKRALAKHISKQAILSLEDQA